MSSEQPKVPPRPSRTQEKTGDPVLNAPSIPPRPQRRTERSVSPSREAFTRSPLNDLPAPSQNGGKLYSQRNLSAQDLPPRPPSVSLPSIGQEGMEYENLSEAERASPEHHSNISPDLPMHAPKASVPQSTAKSRIQTVTRTDSSQAAAAGIGKAETEVHPLRAKSSFSRSNLSLSQEANQEEQEHGIPEIGMQVPMLKFAGDVQAPTPAPSAQGHSIGFADASPRNHHRKRSSRQEFGPPGSYGLHGHRMDPKDKFEKAWYARHPEELAKEHRPYDPGHAPGDWALSSDDLNKLVHQSASRGLGMGTSPAAIGTPDEQIGYMASEEYASRINSPKPRPASVSGFAKRSSSGQLPSVESPLKKEAFNREEIFKSANHDDAIESDAEADVIHIDPPAHRTSKIHGGGYDPPTQDFGPEGGNTDEAGGWIVENGYGVPILASDEVAKGDPSADFLQPAVSPEQERRGNDYYSSAYDSDSSAHGPSRRRSKEKLRTGSAGELTRFKSREAALPSGTGTPLEEIEEYEPLFPEDDDKQSQKPLTQAEKLSRPDLARHHFPSQDIWEDAPQSLQFETTVSGPQEPEDLGASQELRSSTTFESPEKEQARKQGNIPSDRADFLSEETKRLAKSQFGTSIADEMARPNYRHRFPSRDIWEDTPDSLQLQTTVETPQTEEQDILSPSDNKSPQEASRPGIPARPARSSKLSEVSTFETPEKEQQRKEGNLPSDRADFLPEETQNLAKSQPQIPARPGAGKGPAIPDRPKPQVPARPAKTERSESQEGAPLDRVTSPPANVTSPPVKPKPAVPKGSSKFAALKAGFLNDLNSRIGLGPQAPPKHEDPAAEEAPAQEKAPLADARKGRARGPARRKPAAEAASAPTASSTSGFSIGTTFTVFQINEEGSLSVPTSGLSPETAESAQEVERIALANTSGAAPASAPEEEKVALSGLPAQAIGHQGDVPDPKLSQATMDRSQAIQPELEAALADSERQAKNAASEAPVSSEAVTSEMSGTETSSKPEAPSKSETSSKPTMTDEATQTGQQDISINDPEGEQEKLTLMLGGRAPEEGNVVIKEDGEEILGDMDEKHRTTATGGGM